jgi:predicted nucleic acid-binding protein
MSVISNTTVVSNFASINQLDILQKLFGFLYISSEVFIEIQTGLDEGYLFYAELQQQVYPLSSAGWIQLTSMSAEAEFVLFTSLPPKLHAGEASCLAIARCRNWTMLTDDLAARREAVRLGVRLSGTLGCLLMAIEREICDLDQANMLLHSMIKGGYRSPTADLSTFLR